MRWSTLTAVTLVLGCGGPADGVQSIAFLLSNPPPSTERVVPPADDLGADPQFLNLARGRCDLDVAGAAATCTLTSTPQPRPGPNGARIYQLWLLLDHEPVQPRTDYANVGRPQPVPDPDLPPPPPPHQPHPFLLGVINVDAAGSGRLSVPRSDIELDHAMGGELRLIVPVAGGGVPLSYVVLDGRVGNLRDSADPTPAPSQPANGGHQH